jgi:N4-gp56 family major capsid protein
MANAYVSTDTASLGGTAGSAGLVQKAYDRLVEFALRTQPLIRSVSDKRPTNLTNPGSVVNFQIYKDLARVTGTLQETVDPDAVSMSTPTNVPVQLDEYGNAVLVTRALNLFSLADVDPAVANIIAYNMADSIDEVAQTALDGGTNVIYGGTRTTQASITGTDIVTAANIRKAVAKLRAGNAVARKGSMYWCGIHPEVSHDLRKETGAGAWRTPHEYQSNENIWAGEIGAFEGAYFVETPRLKVTGSGATIGSAVSFTALTISGQVATVTSTGHGFSVGDIVLLAGTSGGSATLNALQTITSVPSADSFTFTTGVTGTSITVSSGTATKKTKVHRTFIAGQQALAEAVAEEPHVVIGPVVDKLMRHRPMGWYGVLGFARYREEALYRIESGSSIAS